MKKKELLITAGLVGTATLVYLASRKKEKELFPVVTPFDIQRYLGRWYEIARLDFKWEKNLINTTADYTLNRNGTIDVVNQGWHIKKEEWKISEGKAKARQKNTGALKVSFFGPFFSDYNVVEITNDYKYALIFGESTKYMWILSREKEVPSNILQMFLLKAESFGFNTEDLVWPKHD